MSCTCRDCISALKIFLEFYCGERNVSMNEELTTCVSLDSPSCNVQSSRRSCSSGHWVPTRRLSTPLSQRSNPAAEHTRSSLDSFLRRLNRHSNYSATYHFSAGDGVEWRSKQLSPIYKCLHDEVCHYKKQRRNILHRFRSC